MKPKIELVELESPFLEDEKVFPNLGLLSLATSQDLPIVENPTGDLVGFSATTPQMPSAFKKMREIRKTNPNAKFVLGGAHASSVLPFDPNFHALKEFDYVISGEAEIDIDLNTHYRKTDLIKDINKLPIPDRSKIDIKSYKYEIDGIPATTIMTQRGCPFSCGFCSGRDTEMYKTSRKFSPERVKDEMDYLNSEFGYSAFMWFDDEINISSKRLKNIADLVEDRGYNHRGFVRSDLILKHPESLESLARIGFNELCFGVESGDDSILKNVNKGTTYDMNMKAHKLIKEHGFKTKVFTIVGLPGESYESVMKTKNWLTEASPDSYDATVFSPYPGSKIYNSAVKSDRKDYELQYGDLYFNRPDFSKQESFYKGKTGEYKSLVRTKHLSESDIVNLRDKLCE